MKIEEWLQLGISLLGIVYWKKWPYAIKLFVINIISGTLFTIFAINYKAHYYNNTPPYNIYDFFDTIYIAYAIYNFEKKAIYGKILLGGLLAYCVIHFACIYIEGIHVLATWSLIFRYVLFSSICLAYVINIGRKKSNDSMMRDPVFWLCMSQLVYNCAAIPTFASLNYMIKYHYSLAVKIFQINHVLSWVQLLLVFIALYVQLQLFKKTKPAAGG